MSVTRSADGEIPTWSGRAAAHMSDAARTRVSAVDVLRGLVMVLMALDHTRDFLGAGGGNPRDIAEPALFLTRWITHLCAPTFILLAGLSAFLYGARGRSTAETSRFLLTRGLWLMLVELTVVRLGWRFNFDASVFVFQVIWVIGASMVVLAALVHLPRGVIAVLAMIMIAGHNLLDGVRAEDLGPAGWIWSFLHQPALVRGPHAAVYPLYSLIPWVGVMAAGYALGPVMQLEPARRRRLLVGLGAGLAIGFVLLRATNLYGDPAAWSVQGDGLATALSFINCEKYPASLLYLMMTLGPALLLLAAFEGAREGTRGRLARAIATFGRVPLFYYVVHLYLIHLLAVAYASAAFGDSGWLFDGFPLRKPAGYGLALHGLYGVWLLVVVALYPACRWFAAVKQHRPGWWWSYL